MTSPQSTFTEEMLANQSDEYIINFLDLYLAVLLSQEEIGKQKIIVIKSK